MMSDPLGEFRRRTEGKTITWVFPGEVIEDVDGNVIGVEPNVTATEVDGVAVASWEDES